MRQLSLACLFVLAALAMTGCARKNFLTGGGSSCSSCTSGVGGACVNCRPGTGRMYGQNNDGMICRGGGMHGYGGGSGCQMCGGASCQHCGYLASGWRDGHHNQDYRMDQGPMGPQGAQVAYPYYTTRGPRDFFIDNPPSIGP